MNEKILIVEDEKDIAGMVDYNLKKEGYKTVLASDGLAGAAAAGRERPDLIILDLMLPGIDGLEVCRRLKGDPKTSGIPIIMLTAKSGEADKVVGLELGADDYVTKPFSVRELLARIKAVLRRPAERGGAAERFRSGGLEIDFSKIQVMVKGRPVELAAKEFELLRALIKAKGRVISREALLDAVWGIDSALEVQTRTVDVHIMTLRKKLKGEGNKIVTVKNYGYRLEGEGSDA